MNILLGHEEQRYPGNIESKEASEPEGSIILKADFDAQKKKVKRLIRDHLREIGMGINWSSNEHLGNLQKQQIRNIHTHSRTSYIKANMDFIKKTYGEVVKFYANGNEVLPREIEPEIIEVNSEDVFSRIFRFSTLYWSVPVSRGFGRRLRFVIMDKSNWKVMGILGFCSPVFNLTARDDWIGWAATDREKRLTSVMDAFILGSLPPYSNLLCGKLIASLVATKEINEKYKDKYKNKVSVISKKVRDSDLVLITTASALGPSSVYDRIKIGRKVLYNKVGFTKGFGHFHISDSIFKEMVRLLEMINDSYAHGNQFGNGPNWKMRVIRKCLNLLGMDESLLNHGIKREIYCVPLAENFREYLKGEIDKPEYELYTLDEITEFCRQRWIVPRAKRNSSYLKVDRTFIMTDLRRVMKDQNLLRWVE